MKPMSTDLLTERDAFNAFLDGRIGQITRATSLEDALCEFREYQRELAAAREKVREAQAARDRGEVAELDIEKIIGEVTEELAAEGIRD
jgi:hypothetical protein